MATSAREIAKTVDASARYIGMSASKVREVAALIKGKPIDEARRVLAFLPKEAAREISKVLESAVANAEHNFHLPQEELFVKLIRADESLTMKRFRPRARGRASRIRKRTCSIHLTLERSEELAARAAAPVARRRRAAESGAEKKPRTRRSEEAAPAKGRRAKASAASTTDESAAGEDISQVTESEAPAPSETEVVQTSETPDEKTADGETQAAAEGSADGEAQPAGEASEAAEPQDSEPANQSRQDKQGES